VNHLNTTKCMHFYLILMSTAVLIYFIICFFGSSTSATFHNTFSWTWIIKSLLSPNFFSSIVLWISIEIVSQSLLPKRNQFNQVADYFIRETHKRIENIKQFWLKRGSWEKTCVTKQNLMRFAYTSTPENDRLPWNACMYQPESTKRISDLELYEK